jgi:precorrin-6x reductase
MRTTRSKRGELRGHRLTRVATLRSRKPQLGTHGRFERVERKPVGRSMQRVASSSDVARIEKSHFRVGQDLDHAPLSEIELSCFRRKCAVSEIAGRCSPVPQNAYLSQIDCSYVISRSSGVATR